MPTIYIPESKPEKPESSSLTKDVVAIGRYAKAAAIVGVCTFIALGSILAAAIYLNPNWGWRHLVLALLIDLAVSSTMGGLLGASWTRLFIVARPAYFEDTEFKYRYAPPDPEIVAIEKPQTGWKVKTALWRIVSEHYINGSAMTRDEAVKQLGIEQDTWNRVNTILKHLDIKQAKSWNDALSLPEALARVMEVVEVEDDGSRFWMIDLMGQKAHPL